VCVCGHSVVQIGLCQHNGLQVTEKGEEINLELFMQCSKAHIVWCNFVKYSRVRRSKTVSFTIKSLKIRERKSDQCRRGAADILKVRQPAATLPGTNKIARYIWDNNVFQISQVIHFLLLLAKKFHEKYFQVVQDIFFKYLVIIFANIARTFVAPIPLPGTKLT
jgi:hypothetical protein